MKEMVRGVKVLEDECGGGVVATIGKYFNVYRLGYSDEETISEVTRRKAENELVDETGQLYFEF